MIASGGAGQASHLAEAFEVGAEAALDRVDRARAAGAAARAEGRAERGGMADPAADTRDRPGRCDRARAHARLRRRRGAPPHPRDRRGVVLEPLAARALAQGRDVGQHAWRSRRSATTATAMRSSIACGRTGLPATPAPSRASRPGSGGSSPSARRRGPTGRTSPACSRPGRPRPARKVGEEGVEVALAGVSESDERLVEELADLWFHSYVLLAARGLQPSAVEDELRRRHES